MKVCEFCETYKRAKEAEGKSGLKNNYYAVLHERGIVNGREKGTINHSPVKLIFCPLCGKRLTN